MEVSACLTRCCVFSGDRIVVGHEGFTLCLQVHLHDSWGGPEGTRACLATLAASSR